MKKLLYITLCIIGNVSIAHKLEKVSYAHAHNAENPLELATVTLFFDSMPSVQKIIQSSVTQDGFNHDRYFFSAGRLSDIAQRELQELVHHKNPHYYITYEAISPDGITLDVYYDPRYVTYHVNHADDINFEQKWVLHFYNEALLNMYQHDDKPLIQFAYYSHDKYKTSCFLV